MFQVKALLIDLAKPLAVLVALGFGITAGALHLTSGGFMAPAEFAMTGAFLATLLYPVGPWRWGLLLTLAIPGAYVIAEMVNVRTDIPTIQTNEAAMAFGGPTVAAYLAFAIVAVATTLLKPRPKPGPSP